MQFRQQQIRKHFNVLTACLKVVLNWILFLPQMNAFTFDSTSYVSLFSLWVYSLLIFIPGSIIHKIVSLRCDLHFLRSPSSQHTTRSTRWRDRRRMDQHYSVSSELDLTEFNLEPNGNWVVCFRAGIITASSSLSDKTESSNELQTLLKWQHYLFARWFS